MATIDIRNGANIDKIQFATSAHDYYYGILLERSCNMFVGILDEDGDYCGKIKTKEDAENLIKALQKAIELGWWSK